jgi:hypothetical protein
MQGCQKIARQFQEAQVYDQKGLVEQVFWVFWPRSSPESARRVAPVSNSAAPVIAIRLSVNGCTANTGVNIRVGIVSGMK